MSRQKTLSSTFTTSAVDGRIISGNAKGAGFSINWGNSNQSASPDEVLEAVSEYLTELQKSPEGSDKTARALFEVGKAIEILRDEAPVEVPLARRPPIGPQ